MRGNQARIRKRVPKDLIGVFGKREIIRNLPLASQELLDELNQLLRKGFRNVRNGDISPQDLLQALDTFLSQLRNSAESAKVSLRQDLSCTIPSGIGSPEIVAPEPSLELETLWEAYREEKLQVHAWSPQESYLQVRLWHIWKVHFLKSGITDQSVNLYRTMLLEREDIGLSSKRAYFSKLSAFCRWLTQRRHLNHNPCDGLAIRLGKRRRRDERQPFALEELPDLFSQERFWAPTSGDLTKQLVPQLMLFAGLRTREAVQLHREDFHKSSNGITLMITDKRPGQRLKSAESERQVPLHPGLYGQIDKLLGATTEEYPLVPQARQVGSSSTDQHISKETRRIVTWASRSWLRSTRGKGKSLYSFRHTFATALRSIPSNEKAYVGFLLGHAHSDMTDSRYNSGPPIGELRKIIESLPYSSVVE